MHEYDSCSISIFTGPLLTGDYDLSIAGKVSKNAIDSMTKQITAIEVAVEKSIDLRQPYDLLLNMPGVGRELSKDDHAGDGPH